MKTGLLVFAGGCLGAWARAATTGFFSALKNEGGQTASFRSVSSETATSQVMTSHGSTFQTDTAQIPLFQTDGSQAAVSPSGTQSDLVNVLIHPLMGWDIVTVNLLGAFFLGLLTVYLVNSSQAGWKSFLGTGFCGSFTTYSTMIAALQYGVFALLECFILLLVGLVLGVVAMRYLGPHQLNLISPCRVEE